METEVSFFVVDARGHACPVPVLMLAKALKAHRAVELLADDPAAFADVQALCESLGHEVVALERTGRLVTARVRGKR